LATLLNYMDRQALAVTLPTLKEQFHLTESRVGMVEGCFGFAFAFGSLLFGWLADRVGPRYLYPAVLIGWSAAGIATGCAGEAWATFWLESAASPPGTGVYRWLLLCRVALGVCEAGHWPCALLTVRAILNAQDRTLGNGILQSGASLGAIIVPLYIQAADQAGQPWAFAFWSIGLCGLGWVPLWFLVIGSQELSTPHGYSTTDGKLPAEGEVAWTNAVIRRFIVCGIVVATLTISWQFLRAWLALFLQDYHGYSKVLTRGLMSGYFISADVGCILSGVLVTSLASRGWQVHSARQLGFLIFSLLTACGALVPLAGNGPLMILLLFTAGAGILGLHPYYYSLTQELSVRRMGVLSGALAACGWVVSSLSQILIGRHIEATKSYQLGLLLVGLAPFLGFVALAVAWPKTPEKK
jgi:ACS family hexuronate transporter-like MFS transporter